MSQFLIYNYIDKLEATTVIQISTLLCIFV